MKTNKNEVQENNKLIAEFMGAKYDKHTNFPIHKDDLWLPNHGVCNYSTIELGKGKILHYHDSWDWLMEVVEKIENFRISDSQNSMRFDVKLNHHSCRINDWEIEGKNFIHIGGCHSKIEAVYYACLGFVRWYNQQYKNIENAQKEI